MTDETADKSGDSSGTASGDAASGSAGAGAGTGTQAQAAKPPLAVTAQYVKDLSFENPRAPASLVQAGNQKNQPQVAVGVEVNVRQLQEKKLFEVILQSRVEAKNGDDPLFLVELQYAGLFTIGDVPAEIIQVLLFVEAPRMLFPFARHIIAESVRDGGFPPMLIQPVDFAAMYKKRLEQAQSEQAAQQPAKAATGDDGGAGDTTTA